MRVVTRADFDGIACGVLLTQVERITDIYFVEPKFMQDGEVPVFSTDIIANLPYHPNCAMWFDHHLSNPVPPDFVGKFRIAPSAARVVWEYYNGDQRWLPKFRKFIEDADKIDSASLTIEDVQNPEGYVLISFTIWPGPRHDDYNKKLIYWMRDKPLEEVLEIPEVKGACEHVLEEVKIGTDHILKYSRHDENVIITDTRPLEGRFLDGNRFLIYTLFPQGNVSVKIATFPQKENTLKISVGKSIFNKSCDVNIGMLMAKYGGGGHAGAGTCRIPEKKADIFIQDIINSLKQ
jgi:hypothetical protein